MLEQFLDYIQYEKRQSEHSVIACRGDLIQFQDFLARQYDSTLQDATHSMIRSWLVEIRQAGISNKSIHRKASSLKAYYKYLRREGLLTHNPTARLVLPKLEKRLPEFLKREEIKSVFSTITVSDDFGALRDRLVMLLFYQCGIRLSELVHLKTSSVEQASIKVVGKRNKERIVPLVNEVRANIDEYIELKKKVFSNLANDEYLIVKDDGNPTYAKYIYSIVNKQLQGHTSLQKKSPHILRHTFATHMLDEGADLNSIKEILGHANLTATQVYTHNSLAKIKSIYKQAHPRVHKTS
jgi:integrase/recombinase XerC